MNIVRTDVRSVWTFQVVKLQHFGSEREPFHYQIVVILQPGQSTSVLDVADTRRNDVHGLPVGVRNSSNSFALRWWVFSFEVENLKWFCFDLALKLALYTSKNKNKKAVTIQCVLSTRLSQDGKCLWSVLEN